ncbi:MAG: acetylmuramidase [Hyphomicrobiales bacterium]|nr:acetylmuramidase [Hyphomicrobiales bacterium]
MRSNFDAALALTLRWEGGYSDNPADPGGATNFGVTRATLAKVRARPVSKAEVKALTRAEAATIYRQLYWEAINAEALPGGLDCAAFDCAVNSGPGRALAYLRKVSGAPDAAALAAAITARPPRVMIKAFTQARLAFLERLKTFHIFGRGWRARVLAVEAASLAMAAPSPSAASGDGIIRVPAHPQPQGVNMDTASKIMNGSKPFWASQTVWSALAVIGSSACGGVMAWRTGNIGAFGSALTALLGGINAIVGRYRATAKIG